MRLSLDDITRIRRRKNEPGYEIVFSDGKAIWLTKRRTIVALLMLIHYGESSEADLARGSARLEEVKRAVNGKIDDPDWIRDGYADANKPFSELWNEEGFTWIHPADEKLDGSQKYVLNPEDHEKFFGTYFKAMRQAPSRAEQELILKRQKGKCNMCGSKLRKRSDMDPWQFAKDRIRMVFDHRKPVEKGGDSNLDNYQALCFYCNKSKWQVCNVCSLAECSDTCALAWPENGSIIAPTQEDISDRLQSCKKDSSTGQ